jgi:hypothetical protein
LGLRITPAIALLLALAGWSGAAFRWVKSGQAGLYRRNFSLRQALFGSLDRLLLWGLAAGILVVGLYVLRGRVVAAGSDSYHHTLIVQMILEGGRLPQDYRPFVEEIATFTYHFGFHVNAAVLGWFSGMPSQHVVLVLGVLLISLSALTVAFLTEQFTGSRRGGFAAGVVTGIACVFPTHMTTWGRFPQLEGLVFLSVFLVLVRSVLLEPLPSRRAAWGRAALLGVAAVGLGATHYRAALIAVVACAALLPALWLRRMLQVAQWKRLVVEVTFAVGLTALLFAPWVAHVVQARQVGYPIVHAPFAPSFFAITRLGRVVLDYPTNRLLLALGALAATWGLIRRDATILWTLLWTAAAWVLSSPRLSGFFMDRISTVISLYLPVSVAIGWLVSEIDSRRSRVPIWGKTALVIASAGLLLWFIPQYANNVRYGGAFVGPEDLPAIEWVRENTPPDARFMVNLFHFSFSSDLIIAIDSGYWLPLLARRQTIAPPMAYISEKSRLPDATGTLRELDQLNGQLCDARAWALLRQHGITHVFLGNLGGPIDPEALKACPDFSLEFEGGGAYVFRYHLGPEPAAP